MTCRWHVRAATRPARRRGVPYGSPKIGKLRQKLADFYLFTLHSSLKIGAKAAASCVTHCLLNKDVYNKERDIVHTILLYICLTPCYNAIIQKEKRRVPMYIDWTYIVLVLPAVLLSMWASSNVKNTYAKYAKVFNARGITGAEAARRVLDANGLRSLPIEMIDGELTDHYDPKANVIRLSAGVYGGRSIAAVGVACHEVGHAIQHSVDYAPVKIREAIVPVTNLGAKLSVPLIILGLLLASFSPMFTYLAYIGVALYGLCALFQLVTLPTEFNASRRAVASIEGMELLRGDELEGTKKVLRAAALTYVAALAVTLMQLLRFILIVGNRRD